MRSCCQAHATTKQNKSRSRVRLYFCVHQLKVWRPPGPEHPAAETQGAQYLEVTEAHPLWFLKIFTEKYEDFFPKREITVILVARPVVFGQMFTEAKVWQYTKHWLQKDIFFYAASYTQHQI